YRFKKKPRIISLGLRLKDTQEMGLASEPVVYDSEKDPRIILRGYGASQEECNFLVRRTPHGGWAGDRVELNAMTSSQFIAFLEQKLRDAGVAKFVPDQQVLDRAFRRSYREEKVRQLVNRVRKKVARTDMPPPENLEEAVRERLQKDQTLSW